jgi:hypothetical protein
MPRAPLIAVACLLLILPVRLHGQWYAEAQVGRLDPRLTGSSLPSTTSLAAGLGYRRHTGSLRLTAGVPLSSEDPWWGALDASRRLAGTYGAFTLGVDLAGQGFLQRYGRRLEQPAGPLEPPQLLEGHETGYGVAGQIVPVAELRAGRVLLQARGGRSWYRTAVGERSATRQASLAGVRLALTPAAGALLAVDGRQYWTSGASHRYAGIAAGYALQAVTLHGSVGGWLEPSDQPLAWSAGIAVPIRQRFEIDLEARSDAFDPLYGTAPRRSWTAGVRVMLGAVADARPPVPAAYDGTRARIELPVASAADRPRIAGDFNGWVPEAMDREGDAWVIVLTLEPGVYEYAFVDANGTWFVPPSVPGRREDGMGGHVALLVVGGSQ